MPNLRLVIAALAVALAAPLCAEDFDPQAYFGAEHFTPREGEPSAGRLSAPLKTRVPVWLEPGGSGRGSAADRFAPGEDGLRVKPDEEHGTCELRVDAGLEVIDATVEVHELARGGTVAWHIRTRGEARDFLVEWHADEDGGHALRIRARTRARYVAIPDATADLGSPELPATFRVRLQDGDLIGEVGDRRVRTAAEFPDGLNAAIAVSDEPALVSALSMDVRLHPDWIVAAAARLEARNALARLRETATMGLLGGIRAHGYPGADEALEAYSKEDREARHRARGGDVYAASDELTEIAGRLPEVAMAQHEAGVAALFAGRPETARSHLRAAEGLNPAPITRLALAEAYRRTGEVKAARRALRASADGLPEELAPDRALIEGRLLADRGKLSEAAQVLADASRDFPDHRALATFAQSAQAITNPERLHEIDLEVPFGLRLVSDLEPAELEPLLERLEPYIEQMRKWLPELETPVKGTIALFAGPVEYLRAALIVAGDNIDQVAGMYLPKGISDGPTVMACRGFGEDELVRTLVHELWHLAVTATGRDEQIPRWLNEGMAVFLSAGRVDGRELAWDALPPEFAEPDDGEDFVSRPILTRAVDASSHGFYVPGEVRENYFAAWALVWYYATTDILNVDLRQMLKGEREAISRAIRGDDMAETINARLIDALKD